VAQDVTDGQQADGIIFSDENLQSASFVVAVRRGPDYRVRTVYGDPLRLSRLPWAGRPARLSWRARERG